MTIWMSTTLTTVADQIAYRRNTERLIRLLLNIRHVDGSVVADIAGASRAIRSDDSGHRVRRCLRCRRAWREITPAVLWRLRRQSDQIRVAVAAVSDDLS